MTNRATMERELEMWGFRIAFHELGHFITHITEPFDTYRLVVIENLNEGGAFVATMPWENEKEPDCFDFALYVKRIEEKAVTIFQHGVDEIDVARKLGQSEEQLAESGIIEPLLSLLQNFCPLEQP